MTAASDPEVRLAEVLDRIASGGPVSAHQALAEAGFVDAAAAADMLLAVLRAFGVVKTSVDGAGRLLADASTSSAALFLRSLAQHIRDGLALLDNWERTGTSEPPYQPHEALAGPQLLYLLEQRRLRLDAAATPLRDTAVSQIVIKVRFRLLGTRYLVIYDPNARQFQLPGGHQRSDDVDATRAALRELDEELPDFSFDRSTDGLRELGFVEVAQPSRTFGAITNYRVTLFQLVSKRKQFRTPPGSRWITEQVLLGDRPIDGVSVNAVALQRYVDTTPGRTSNLADSIHVGGRMSAIETFRDKTWEIFGIILGVVGIVVSVVTLR